MSNNRSWSIEVTQELTCRSRAAVGHRFQNCNFLNMATRLKYFILKASTGERKKKNLSIFQLQYCFILGRQFIRHAFSFDREMWGTQRRWRATEQFFSINSGERMQLPWLVPLVVPCICAVWCCLDLVADLGCVEPFPIGSKHVNLFWQTVLNNTVKVWTMLKMGKESKVSVSWHSVLIQDWMK